MQKALISCALAALLVAGCGHDEDLIISFKVGPELDAAQKEMVEKAVHVWAAKCREFAQAWSDVVIAHATIEEPPRSAFVDAEERGWNKQVVLEVVLNDHLEKVPRGYRAQGQHCYYEMGGGREPGIGTAKGPCKQLCGLAPDAAGSGAFISAPELAFVK